MSLLRRPPWNPDGSRASQAGARAIGLLLLAPLGAFAAEAALGGGLSLSTRAWGNTLALAGTAALLALAAGVPAGFALAQARRRWPFALTLVPMLVPPALWAALWMALRLPTPGAAACGLMLAAGAWPVVALLVAASLARIPRAQIDAAELAGGRVVRTVAWPHARPAALAGALVVFLLGASEFSVPATFAVPTVSSVIYEKMSAFEFAAALSAALPLVALAGALAFVLRRVPAVPQSAPSRPFLSGAPLHAARAIAAVAWLATAALPAVVFARTVGSVGRFAQVVSIHAESLAWSACVAGAAAGLLVAWASLSPTRSRLEPLWLAALVLPGVVPALGALTLAGHLGVQAPLAQSGALLVLALMTRFAWVAWMPLREPVERAQLEAAELAAMPRARAWRRVTLPALWPRAAAAGAIVFVLCLGEIGPCVLLGPPGRQTAVQHMFNWMHYGYDETVAAMALVLMAAAALFSWVAIHVGRRAPDPVAG